MKEEETFLWSFKHSSTTTIGQSKVQWWTMNYEIATMITFFKLWVKIMSTKSPIISLVFLFPYVFSNEKIKIF
jgi:hypothetical protein